MINHPKHTNIKAAYLFYYATEVGLTDPLDKDALKARLNTLVSDSLVYCKQYKFDVYNALSLMDNGLFLEDQKFGPGDGQLHYYLFNYRANPIGGGVDKRNRLDSENLSGIGYVSQENQMQPMWLLTCLGKHKFDVVQHHICGGLTASTNYYKLLPARHIHSYTSYPAMR